MRLGSLKDLTQLRGDPAATLRQVVAPAFLKNTAVEAARKFVLSSFNISRDDAETLLPDHVPEARPVTLYGPNWTAIEEVQTVVFEDYTNDDAGLVKLDMFLIRDAEEQLSSLSEDERKQLQLYPDDARILNAFVNGQYNPLTWKE